MLINNICKTEKMLVAATVGY